MFVDGAHALGSISIDIKNIGVDYYVSCAHKWLCSPKVRSLTYGKYFVIIHNFIIIFILLKEGKKKSLWFFFPIQSCNINWSKGCAFLWVRPNKQNMIKPLAISHGFGSGFTSDFIWTGKDFYFLILFLKQINYNSPTNSSLCLGLRDYSSMLVLPSLIEYWNSIGWERVRNYNSDLLSWAGEVKY